MEKLPPHEQQPQLRLRKLGRGIINFARDLVHVLNTTDTNPHEGKLRYSAAPKEYLGLDYENIPRPDDTPEDQ